ncbi:unnamed protein product [Clonostachys chloroleuca]|uniref:Uncharacterized protein n=1 Tax=Clonostachys chloroleuca TaxID=1926264 RepID=A0AA35VA64_9HYPO|nr:unnamed protein product [Clonostachys chloroleuca]
MDSFVWDHLLPKQGYVVVCRNGSIKRVYALPGFASSMCRLTSELDNENVAGTEIEASDTRGLSESNFIRDAGMTCAMMAAAMSSGGLKATASMRAGFPHKPFLAGVPSRRKQPCIPSVAMASAAPRTAPTEEQAMRLRGRSRQRIVLGAEDHLPASIPVKGIETGLQVPGASSSLKSKGVDILDDHLMGKELFVSKLRVVV